jgi:hypothetical protein
MASELATITAEMTPYVTTALSAYGGAVLAKVRDDAADATVGSGRRLLQRIFGRRQEDEPLPVVLADVVGNPSDEDALGALRYTIRKALENDAQMLAEVREILAQAAPAAATVTVTQNVKAGRNAYVAGRDANITR